METEKKCRTGTSFLIYPYSQGKVKSSHSPFTFSVRHLKIQKFYKIRFTPSKLWLCYWPACVSHGSFFNCQILIFAPNSTKDQRKTYSYLTMMFKRNWLTMCMKKSRSHSVHYNKKIFNFSSKDIRNHTSVMEASVLYLKMF